MLVTFGWITIGCLAGLAVMQSIYVWLHCQFLRSKVNAALDESYAPRVAVILCVRGSDPSLINCLTALTQLDYANHEIHVVADDAEDPALQTVQEFFARQELANQELANQEAGKPTTHVLKEHATTRSLKCSAIITAVNELEEAIEVIALIDADAVVDRGWLKDLVQPLADPTVGATTGNRWFGPAKSDLGSDVRLAWNAAAVAQMTLYQIPWGGSLALKRSTIERCDLLSHWSTAFCEDTMLTRILKENELRMVRVPNLVVSNDESTTLANTFHWIVRQLLTVRLHHRDWPLVLFHGLFSGACLIAAPIVISALYLVGETILATGVLAVLCAMELANMGLLRMIQSANLGAFNLRSDAAERHESTAGILAILVTQLLYPVAIVKTAMTRRVSWRGIEYAIGPGSKVAMLEYRRYRDCQNHVEESDKLVRSID